MLPNGHRQKVKTEWYVKRHRAKDLFESERKLVRLFLDDKLDDVLPLLSSDDKQKALDLQRSFWDKIVNAATKFDDLFVWSQRDHWSKKELALDPDFKQSTKSVLFRLWDGKNSSAREALEEFMGKSLSTAAKYEAFKETYRFDWSIDT